jgi:hypothetical protein
MSGGGQVEIGVATRMTKSLTGWAGALGEDA